MAKHDAKNEHVDTEIMVEDGDTIIDYSTDVGSQEAPPPLPARDYVGTCKTAVVKTSQSSGNKYVAIAYVISPDQYPPDYVDGNPDGETLSYNRTPVANTPKARYQMRKLCEAHGVVAAAQVDLNQLIGTQVKLTVGNSVFEGETRAEIKRIAAVD